VVSCESKSLYLSAIAGVSVILVMGTTARANLFSNPSFEIGPGGTGILPTDWDIRTNSPDTFIPGGGPLGRDPTPMYGATAVAHHGDRWVGAYGGQTYFETFGQTLASTLTPGQAYVLSGWLLENDAVFSVGNGGYEVWLGTATTEDVFLGAFAPTTGPGAWQSRSFNFVAPATAASLPVVIFRPYAAPGYADAWPGLDSLDLDVVPEPGAAGLLAVGALVCLRRRCTHGGHTGRTGMSAG
jgi:hypothetical protein